MDDTWATRDLPVLDAVVRLLEGKPEVSMADIAAKTGLELDAVGRALMALEGPYVSNISKSWGFPPSGWRVSAVTPDARRAIGQWPTPESIVDQLADGGAADWLLDLLRQALGPGIPAPTEIAVSSWGSDPWSGGAYSHIRPGGSAADADLLGTPVAGRLCFAGEHTQSARLVYTDGAFCSGIREAKRLLRSPSVRLQFSPAAHPSPNALEKDP